MTLANLQQSGTTPFVKDRLHIYSNGFEMRYLINFNIFVGILWGPVALEESNLSISSSISFDEIGFKKILLSCLDGIKDIEEVLTDGIFEAKLWPIFAKKSLKALAIDLQSVNSVLFVSILEGKLIFIGFKLSIFSIPLHMFLTFVLLVSKYLL